MIHVGLVGLGFIGRAHLKAFEALPNAKVIQICSRSSDDEVLNDFTGEITFEYDALLSNEEIDVIDICVPTFLHEEYIVKAAKAGKNIICEKPLALTVEATKRIIQIVEKMNVRLFVGHVLRFWPAYQKIKQMGEKGDFSAIETLHAKRLGQVPAWSEWFQHPEKSGGALFDLHLHDIDFAYYLLGEVESVYAVGQQNNFGAWDHIMTTLRFKNQANAFVEASHAMPSEYPFTMSLRAQAQDATIDFKLVAGKNIEHINQSQFILYEGKDKSEIIVEEADAFKNELAYFIYCLENNQENKVITLDDVLYIIELLESIEQSLKTGKIQFLDSKTAI